MYDLVNSLYLLLPATCDILYAAGRIITFVHPSQRGILGNLLCLQISLCLKL
jgi:hypothetical protein